MKHLKLFEQFKTEEDIDFYFDYINEQASTGRIFGKLSKINPKNLKNFKVTSEKPPGASSTKTKGFDLSRAGLPPKRKRKPWDYQEEKIGDDLILVKNPRGSKNLGAVIKEVRKVSDPKQYIALKMSDGPFGKHYYMSSYMPSNSVEAGKAYLKLMEFIPKGSYFGEPMSGSLSTDSFYNVFKRVKSGKFDYEIKGRMGLNPQGTKKYQEAIRNSVDLKYSHEPMYFKSRTDAKRLRDAMNKDIKSVNDKELLCKVRFNKERQMWYIDIPRIFLKVK
jgi:hypothetical protein